MRIGVFTFHKPINYGSVLQAWALQTVLKDNGYYSEIIDYEPKELKHIYEISIKDARGFKRTVKKALAFRKSADLQRSKFDEFIKNNICISESQYYYDSDFTRIANEYDVLITGSDQVWNTNILDCDPIFFLPFPFAGKKIAYACSVNEGCVNDRFKEEWLKKWLHQYDFISIREARGVDKVNMFLGSTKRVYNTLDPTLLLTPEEYSSLIGNRIVAEKYIFLYNMWTKRDGIDAAKFISKKMGLPVYTLTNQMDLIRISKYTMNGIRVDIEHTGPKDFLNYIFYSEFVLTDSFHGTALSIAFNKQFFSLNRHVNKGTYKNDERLMSILSHELLKERFVTLEDIKSVDYEKTIDYEKINRYFESMRAQSLTWLIEAIKGNIQS